MKTSTVIRLITGSGFIVMLLSAVKKLDSISQISVLLCISLILAIPLCVLAWKFRAKLVSKKTPIIAALAVPIALVLWKWIGSVSVIAQHIMIFVAVFLGLFIAFFFEEKYLKL